MSNINPTKQVLALAKALEEKGIKTDLEYWDGHKHIDMYIPDAKLGIEIDGLQHFTDPKQFMADLKRDYYSDINKIFTKHISNQLIETHLEEIANTISEVVRERKDEITNMNGKSMAVGETEDYKS